MPPDIAPYITPEILAGIVTLIVGPMVAALAVGIRAYSKAKEIETRAAAEDRKSENDQAAAILRLLGQQIDNAQKANETAQQTNTILLEYKSELSESRRTTDKVAVALTEHAAETRLLRQDLKVWPLAVDSTLSTVDTHVNDMVGAVNDLDRSVQLLVSRGAASGDEHRWIKDTLKLICDKLELTPPPYPTPKIKAMEDADAEGQDKAA